MVVWYALVRQFHSAPTYSRPYGLEAVLGGLEQRLAHSFADCEKEELSSQLGQESPRELVFAALVQARLVLACPFVGR